ncbi:hypothetical protein [Amycolatopsis rubida]|uniref:hypothetical protein n=1 Tax=Amycolatopsis TaxID=1813 RepID=UPI0007E29703|nr:Sulfate transporter family protein [Amycolatopsis sp. M39]
MINVKVAGSWTRLSTFLAGAFLMVLCLVFGPVVSRIPMAALVAAMVLVAFDWHSIAPVTLKRMPVGAGRGDGGDRRHRGGDRQPRDRGRGRVDHRDGDLRAPGRGDPGAALFFASSNDLVYQFDYAGDPQRVVVYLSAAHIWDVSTVAALDAIGTKCEARGEDRRDRRPDQTTARRCTKRCPWS